MAPERVARRSFNSILANIFGAGWPNSFSALPFGVVWGISTFLRSQIARLAICTGERIASRFVPLSSGEERSADGCTAPNCEFRIETNAWAGKKRQLFTLPGGSDQKTLAGTSTLV